MYRLISLIFLSKKAEIDQIGDQYSEEIEYITTSDIKAAFKWIRHLIIEFNRYL